MNWTTGAGKSINFFDITQKIKSHNKNKGQVIVGTDSHVKRESAFLQLLSYSLALKIKKEVFTFIK